MPRDVVVVLPDIRSLYNVGSFFRTGDAVGVSKIILCGTTGTPRNPKLAKVSLGAEQTVPWEYSAEPLTALQTLQVAGYQIVVVEKTVTSQPYQTVHYSNKVALVFGAEVSGVSGELLSAADVVVHLPMLGTKRSLNVSVVGGVMLYYLFGS
ncbi:MAG: TrmH family RNA methyltransferase [Candidatus Kerfeldbacteria bacterium]|nr:TrmH family RNA methyltransferase [Candidatus Kerfeldbacteria bacterium]